MRGVSSTAQHTIDLIQKTHTLLSSTKQDIRKKNKFYSQDLINNLFRHPLS
jgi:hypothetical protein